MSTGADPKTMPVTAAYVDGHERIFGVKSPQRGFWVMRCETCHGVRLPEGEARYDCGTCGGKDTRGSINLNEAPPLPPAAVNAPILSGRFYENTLATDGTDIGSRAKHREYLARTGYVPESDCKPDFYERQRKRREQEDFARTRETVARICYERWKP